MPTKFVTLVVSVLLAACPVLHLAPMAQATLVLDDPLQGATLGTRSGGEFVAGGWQVTAKDDTIYWHVPTITNGAIEFDLRGLDPNECRAGMEDKTELFHMYDYTFGNSDINYNNAYRDNPFKHFIRKIGCLDTAKTDAMEIVWQIRPNYVEPDTARLSWNSNKTYHFREEWGPDDQGNAVLKVYRDGALLLTTSVAGDWNPSGHSVRIAASTRRAADAGAPIGAIFSNVKVWDFSRKTPGAPRVTEPVKGETVTGPLAVHPKNPRYFQNTATGDVVYLTGSHTWANLVDIGPKDPPPKYDFKACLDWMEKLNHNFIRMWTWELVSWNTKGNRENKLHTSAPQPFARTGPGKALDGKLKFDLKKYNPAYFERLRRRITAARERGIYVSVMLFEGWGLQFSPGAWEGHPFNPKNNVNGIDGDSNKDGKGVEVHTLGNKAVTALQEAYVRKVIDTVNSFDNVLYEISNENHPPSTQWQYHIIRYIKNYEKNKPKQHPVGMTFQYRNGKNETLFKSPADWISPNNEGGYRDNPPQADGRKVVLNDTDHLWGIGGNQAWVWKSFLRGHNPIFMDPYDGVVLGNKFDSKWDPIRRSMGYTRQYAEKMDLAAMLPRNNLASTRYCLANPGQEYLVYNPAADKPSITVNLKAGTYKYEWFNPDNGKVASTGTIKTNGGEKKFEAPFKGDAVLYLRAKHSTG